MVVESLEGSLRDVSQFMVSDSQTNLQILMHPKVDQIGY